MITCPQTVVHPSNNHLMATRPSATGRESNSRPSLSPTPHTVYNYATKPPPWTSFLLPCSHPYSNNYFSRKKIRQSATDTQQRVRSVSDMRREDDISSTSTLCLATRLDSRPPMQTFSRCTLQRRRAVCRSFVFMIFFHHSLLSLYIAVCSQAVPQYSSHSLSTRAH